MVNFHKAKRPNRAKWGAYDESLLVTKQMVKLMEKHMKPFEFYYLFALVKDENGIV